MSDIRENRLELLHYDDPDFPVFFRNNKITADDAFEDTAVHWHDELEFIYIRSGRMNYQVNGKRLHMSAGEGIFINSRQLHIIVSDHADCELLCLIFPPMLLSSVSQKLNGYVSSITADDNIPYIMLDRKDEWKEGVIENMELLEQAFGKPLRELEIMKLLFDIWKLLYGNTVIEEPGDRLENRNLVLVKKMLDYIHQNYTRRLRMPELCAEGNVGKTTCTRLFSSYLNMTPMEYVKHYRVMKGKELLRKTELTVTEIAYAVGLCGGSYFSEEFRKLSGCTPLEYRRRERKLCRNEG